VTFAHAAVVVRRRWWIALLGVLLTAAAAAWVQRAPGVYYQQVDVVFLWPESSQAQGNNTFQYGSAPLIRTAGVVARAVSGPTGTSTVSETATLAGQGIRHGWSVRLPNSGGQWAFDFEQPVLSVEAVGTTPAEVTATSAAAVGRIRAELSTLQASERVPAGLLIRTRLSPPLTQLRYEGGDRRRALLVTVLLGAGLTSAAVRLADRRLRRRAAPPAERALVPA
jgi:hypothetical protein